MKKKTYVAAAVAGFVGTGLMFAGVTFAANEINPKVTSTNIGLGTTCGVSSPITLEFDRASSIALGDKFTVTLPLQTGASVTLCKDLDFVIAQTNDVVIDANGGMTAGTGLAVADIGADNSVSPIYYTTTAPAASDAIFRVTGSKGGQIITIESLGTIAAGDTTDLDTFSIEILGQKDKTDYTGAGAATDYLFKDDPTTSGLQYTEDLEDVDNAFCINVSDWPASVIQASFDTNQQSKYTFTDTNRKIAAIVSGSAISKADCKTAKVGTIIMSDPAQAGGSSCGDFDNDTTADYCTDTHSRNYVDFSVADGLVTGEEYMVTLTILVDGQEGNNGVYFSAGAGTTIYENNGTCGGDTSNGQGLANTFKLASGKDADTAEMKADGCQLDNTDGQAVVANSAYFTAVGGANNTGLSINLPNLIYTDASDGEKVEVKVELSKKPCGIIADGTWDIGSFGASCDTTATSSGTFPYFAQPGLSFWNGIAVTNYSNVSGDVKLTMYETDGDVGEATVTIAANSMFVDILNNLIQDGTFTLISGSGTLGDARSYITMSSETLSIDGFSMIANNATGESMGYLPRK